jgi:hypothetical protein
MIWARWAGVMGVPMKWEIARIFVVGTGGRGFCAEAAPSGVIGFFMAVAPYSSSLFIFRIVLLTVSTFDGLTTSASRRRRRQPSVGAYSSPENRMLTPTFSAGVVTVNRPCRCAMHKPAPPDAGAINCGLY